VNTLQYQKIKDEELYGDGFYRFKDPNEKVKPQSKKEYIHKSKNDNSYNCLDFENSEYGKTFYFKDVTDNQDELDNIYIEDRKKAKRLHNSLLWWSLFIIFISIFNPFTFILGFIFGSVVAYIAAFIGLIIGSLVDYYVTNFLIGYPYNKEYSFPISGSIILAIGATISSSKKNEKGIASLD